MATHLDPGCMQPWAEAVITAMEGFKHIEAKAQQQVYFKAKPIYNNFKAKCLKLLICNSFRKRYFMGVSQNLKLYI